MPRRYKPTGKPGGRPAGAKNKATIERELREAQEAERKVEEARTSGRRLAKDMLDDFMHKFAQVAASFQPVPANTPPPEGVTPNPNEFERWAKLAVECAKALAKYQSPTFQAIMVAPPPPDPTQEGQRRRFTLTIFDGARPRLLAPTNGRDGA